MEFILNRITTDSKFSFTSLLPEKPTIAFLVATFLACLELARLGSLHLEQEVNFQDILCTKPLADSTGNSASHSMPSS
jgi:segregation and condensation protein A